MLHAIQSYFARRDALRRDADALVAEHGEEALAIAYRRARDAGQFCDATADQWMVVSLVKRRLGTPDRVDTATRYLEGGRERGQHPWLW